MSQISELNQEDKNRLYQIIERFLFAHQADITKEQNKDKVAVAHRCPHCQSTRTRKNGHQKRFNDLYVMIVKRIFGLVKFVYIIHYSTSEIGFLAIFESYAQLYYSAFLFF